MREGRQWHGSTGDEFELGEEHGGYTVQSGTFILLDTLQCGEGVKSFGGENDCGTFERSVHALNIIEERNVRGKISFVCLTEIRKEGILCLWNTAYHELQ